MNNNFQAIFKRCLLYAITFMLGVIITIMTINQISNEFKKSESKVKIEREVTVVENGIADAVEKVYDSVVVITTYQKQQTIGSGSGFIYKDDGTKMYLLTNEHVVEGGDSFKVTFTDGEVLDASLVGSDVYSDIAVLEIESKLDYKAVTLGDSSTMRVGDTTFTIGAPLGDTYSWSVTRGILSGKERLVEFSLSSYSQSDYIMNVLQTDCAVNSGNSGGPIANSNGEVIGIVNAKISATGVEGIGFAIPIETAIEKAETIINGNDSMYPYLGISMFNVTEAKNYINFRKYFINNNIEEGVFVIDIEPNSPAANKLKQGDIIIAINDVEVENVAYLRYELYKNHTGDTIDVTIIRGNKKVELSIELF